MVAADMLENGTVIKGYKYTITQSAKGARITVHGDAIEEIVSEYARIRIKLEEEGFRVAPDE